MAAPAENDPTVTAGGQATRVVLAPEKFKGSLAAAEVAAALAAGMHDVLAELINHPGRGGRTRPA